MYLFISRLSLVLEIFLYDLLIGILAYRVHVISTRPKLTAPKHPFHFWMKPKYFLCGNTLYRVDNLFRSIHRNALNQKMNVVAIKAYFQKMNFISLLYPKANLFESDTNLITQNFSPIFYRTYKMIQKQALVMTFVDMFTHTHKYKYLYATPEAEPRGILLIKFFIVSKMTSQCPVRLPIQKDLYFPALF